jgi:hypothetical protein
VNIEDKEKAWDDVITEQFPDERSARTKSTGARNAEVVTSHRLYRREPGSLDAGPYGLCVLFLGEIVSDWPGANMLPVGPSKPASVGLR